VKNVPETIGVSPPLYFGRVTAEMHMMSKFMEEIKGKNVEIFIIYTNNFNEMADLRDKMLENPDIKDVKMVPLTPVVGCHAGPGTMGLGYVEL